MHAKYQEIKRLVPENPDNIPQLNGFHEQIVEIELAKVVKSFQIVLQHHLKESDQAVGVDPDKFVKTMQYLLELSKFSDVLTEEVKKVRDERLDDLRLIKGHFVWGSKLRDSSIKKQFKLDAKEAFQYDLKRLHDMVRNIDRHGVLAKNIEAQSMD